MKILYITDLNSMKIIKNLMDLEFGEKDSFNNWLNGELYFNAIIYNNLVELEKMKKMEITYFYCDYDNIFEKNIMIYDAIFVPGWHDIPDNMKILKEYNEKIFNTLYFPRESIFKNRNILNPYKYNLGSEYTRIGISPIKINENLLNMSIIKKTIFENENIKGLIWSKCISHFVYHNEINDVLDLLYKSKNKFYCTLHDIEQNIPPYMENIPDKHRYIKYYNDVIKTNKVLNLGTLDIINFRFLLKNIKFIIGFGDPRAGPTISECLNNEVIVISPKKQIPEELHENKNIILMDNYEKEEILLMIDKIINGQIIFDKNDIPHHLTNDGIQQNILNIIK